METDGFLSLRPRMLRSQAALVLGIPERDIPYGAFRAWVGRYRKKNNLPPKKKNADAVKKKETESENEGLDWRDFKPTELVVPSYRDDGPIFKRITYGQLDG